MENNKSTESIDKKVIGSIEYELIHWINDGLFVIYKLDKNLKGVQRIPEIFQSHNEKEAKEYFKNLT